MFSSVTAVATSLTLASAAGSSAVYTHTGGDLFVTSIDVGAGAGGTFNISGTANASVGDGILLRDHSSLNVAAGAALSAGSMTVGHVINQTGGTVQVSNELTLQPALLASPDAAYNLTGGTLTVGTLAFGTG